MTQRTIPSQLAVSGQNLLLGRSAAGAGGAEELTSSAVRTILSVVRGISGFCSGKPLANEVIGGVIAPYAFTLSQANSSARALVANGAGAGTTFDIRNNGTSIGSIAFAVSATLATVTISTTAVAAGDYITVHAPGTVADTPGDIMILLRE